MNRFYEFNKTRKHRKEVRRIAKEKGYSFPFHDFIKMINILIFGDKIATELHRAFSSHHDQIVGEVYKYENGKKVHLRYICDIENKIEAAIDWESARFTKPEKQLTAYETWRKLYPDIDMKETLKSLGFWEGK